MTVQFHPIQIVYFTACMFSLAMVLFSQRMIQVRGARIWRVVMLFCAVWSAADGLEILLTDLGPKLFMVRISYLGVIGTTVFWSVFILHYSNNQEMLSPGLTLGLLIVPAVTSVAVMTLHPYFYRSVKLIQVNGLWELSRQYGPLFWVWAAYAYAAILGSGVLLAQAVLRFPHQFQGQMYLLLLAGLMPLISNFLYITGNNFMAPFDPSAPAFVISGLLVGYGFRRYRFLDVVPVAHDLVFKQVNSGVIVVDNRGLVLEMNPAAEEITGLLTRQVIGEYAGQAFSQYAPLANACLEEPGQDRLQIGRSVYEIRQTAMADKTGRKIGQVILLYDITALKATEKRLSVVNDKLKQLATTDSLTQVFNRRHFFYLARQEKARAQQEKRSLAMILVDLDNFKCINDTHGHPRGDEVLKVTAQCLVQASRKGDIIGRLGGDEFIVLACGSDAIEARILGERFCQTIPAELGRLTGLSDAVTLSIGVAACSSWDPVSLDALLEQADQALYQAKREGKSRVFVWSREASAP